MSTFTLLIIFTAIYWITCLAIGIWVSRVEVKKPSDFFLGGHSIGPVVMGLAMMATVFSAWFILGHQGSTWQVGFPYITNFAHIPLMGMLSVIFFGRLWAITRKNGYITPSEMYGDYFNSELLRILVVIVAVLYAIPYVALQLRGAGYVFNVLSGGVVSPQLGAFVLGLVVVLYVFLGGLKAAAITDSLQGVLLIIGAFLLGTTTISVVTKLSGGAGFWAQWYQGVVSVGESYITMPKTGAMWGWQYVLTFAIATCGIYMSPSYTMLVSAAKGPKVFKYQGLILMTGIMGIMYFIFTMIVGTGGRSILKELANSDALSLELIFNYMGPIPFCITAIGILAAMNSTAAGYLANTSTILARDLYLRYMNPKATPQFQVLMGRLMVLVIVGLAVIFSLVALDYLTILGSLATAFGLLMAPAVFGITYCPGVTKEGVNAGIIAGVIAVIITYFIYRYPWGIHMGGWGFIANAVVCSVVSLFTQKPAKDKILKTHGIWDKDIAAKMDTQYKSVSM